MRTKHLLILFISIVGVISNFAQTIASDTCIISGGGPGNVVIFSNYDGGVLNINVDQNIPNLKIGICTYEPVTINLSGAFVNNVTEVRYAGYVSTNNNHCSNSPTTTTIVGAPGGAITSVNFLPPATLANPNGYNSIVCAYSCNIAINQGGCNTADQIQDYFLSTMGGSLYSYFTQYGCWSVAPYTISAGGNCFFTGTPDTTITIFSATSSTLCVGETVNFTDLSPDAVSWNWTITSSSVPTSSSQNVNNVFWIAPGNYMVTLSTNDGDGNCSASYLITVIDNPTLNPTATPNPICNGDTANLIAIGANVYQWNPGGPSINSWSVNPSINTWYYVTGTDLNGCITNDSIQVIVNPTPPTPTINYSGGILVASPPAPAYQWYLNGSLIVGATGPNHIPTQNGNYTVMYTDSNGCESLISSITIVSDMGLETNGNSELNIFPNPSNGIFQINMPDESQEVLIEVIDALGKIVYTKKTIINSIFTIDLSGESKGTYQVKLTRATKTITGKIVIH